MLGVVVVVVVRSAAIDPTAVPIFTFCTIVNSPPVTVATRKAKKLTGVNANP